MKRIRRAAVDNVPQTEWVTGSEDFWFYGEKPPAFFFYAGEIPKGNDANKAVPHRTAGFFVDDNGMRTGVKAFCNLVFDYMNLPASTVQSIQSSKTL